MEEETETSAPTSLVASVVGNRNTFMTVVVVAVVVIGAAGYFWWQSSQVGDPQAAAEQEARELVARVSELIVLPEGEDPVIATVADPARLQDTPFFEKAKVGDKVLIYNSARKAVLYDPAAHRILEVAPLNIGQPVAQ